MNRELARVEDCRLEIEDPGILTCWLELHKEDGFHQSFGGYSLDSFDKSLKRRKGTAEGMDWVLRLLQIFHVSKLEDIKERMCYALYDEDKCTIQGIQTLDIDGGEFFTISEWKQQWFPKKEMET